MKIVTYLCALILLIVGVCFSLLNSADVSVNYLLGTATLPVSFLIIISIAIGALLSLFFCGIKLFNHKASIYQLKRKIESLEKAALKMIKE